MSSCKGRYIRNTSYILQIWRYICNSTYITPEWEDIRIAYMYKLCESAVQTFKAGVLARLMIKNFFILFNCLTNALFLIDIFIGL